MRIIKLTGGTILLVAGIAGAVLPVVPGWPFLLGALPLLSAASPRVRKLLRILRKRHPSAFRVYDFALINSQRVIKGIKRMQHAKHTEHRPKTTAARQAQYRRKNA